VRTSFGVVVLIRELFLRIHLATISIFSVMGGTSMGGKLMALQLSGGGLLSLAPLLFIFAIFYFLLIMPQQRKQKKWQAMLSELKTGDKIVTTGGLRGTIISLKDDAITLRVPPDNLKLEVTRGSVVSVATAEEAK
jgi:preprotein translocase subunit YajC